MRMRGKGWPGNGRRFSGRGVAASLCGLTLALLFAACARSDDPTSPQPKKVYRDGFSTPVSEVEIEADGGTILGAYDASLIIRAESPLALKGSFEYRPVDCGPLVAYFERELRLANTSIAVSLLDCQQATDPRLPFENGRWVAHSATGGRLFYRVWKYR